MRVLVVDRSVQIIDGLVDILSDAKNITDIHSAVSHEDAKKLFKENKHDAVLLDIDLPGNESFKLLEEIKKTSRKTCVIILSAHVDGYIQEQYKSLGADFFFDKYYDFEKICGVIDSIAMASDITEKVKLQRQLVDEQMNKQKEIARAVINAQEKERAEIGEELHDNINQLLTASNLFLNHSLTQDNYKPFIIKSKEIICDAIEEIRKLSKELVGPSKMEAKGLITSVMDLIYDISLVKNININFNYSFYKEEQTDVDFKVVIYRIIQEQLNNILKHAEASEAEIELKKRKDSLVLLIKDNGKGFNTAAKRKGIGLKNIEHRVEIYNGSVEIFSSPGKGCKMEINFKQTK